MLIVGLFKGVAKLCLWAASMAFIIAVSLLLLGSYILTWPILRKSPRDQKITAVMNLATAGLTAMQVLGRERMAQLAAAYAEVEDDPDGS